MSENENNYYGNQNEQKQIMQQATDIIDIAKQNVTEGADAPSNGDVADKFRGLPMRELIAGPLLAAAEAQQKLAAVSYEFYQKIAFEQDANDKPTKNARVLEFNVERPVETTDSSGGGQIEMINQTIKAPFIGLVPIPALLIDKIDVDFQMEVSDTNTTTDKSSASAETNISAKWWVVSASVTGKVASSRENTRTSNQTAKYQIHVSASQQKPTEGLSKLMDIMASCIEPIKTTQKA